MLKTEKALEKKQKNRGCFYVENLVQFQRWIMNQKSQYDDIVLL